MPFILLNYYRSLVASSYLLSKACNTYTFNSANA